MNGIWPEPAYVIETPRLVLRPSGRSDLDAICRVIEEGAPKLLPWMPWAKSEPLPRRERAALQRRFRGMFDLGEDFIYGVFDGTDGSYLGGAGLHPRIGPGALELGYWITPSRWGEGLATEAAAALTHVAFNVMSARRVEIRVAPGNTQSLAIPRKLGFTEEGRLRGIGPEDETGEPMDLCIFGMMAEELSGSPVAAVKVLSEAFDPGPT